MLTALLKYNFLQNALLSAILASVACGIIGTIIMEKKLVMISGGIAHTAFGGIGMGYFLGIEPMIGGLIFSILAALGIATIHHKTRTYSDILIGMFWSFGMALGILFIAFTPGYPPDMTSYLFGDILTVSRSNLLIISVLDLIIITIIFSFFNLFKAYLFDEEYTTVIGKPTTLLEYTLFILIALTVVILIRVVGIILIIALLTVPTALAKQFTFSLNKIMLFSSILGIIFCVTGLWISYMLGIPSGATIIILSITVFVIVSIVNNAVKRSTTFRKKNRQKRLSVLNL